MKGSSERFGDCGGWAGGEGSGPLGSANASSLLFLLLQLRLVVTLTVGPEQMDGMDCPLSGQPGSTISLGN